MTATKRIAKNTLFLYVRMFLIMGVTLYTSRVILSALGISDFGIYSIVGGIVAMFGFINGAMLSATQRYLSVDIGKGDLAQLNKTFNSTLSIHFFLAIVILLVGETLGLWYVNNKLEIPESRLYALNVVYQFSLFTLFLNIIQVPYNSLILARERMSIYAYVSIIEVILKLLVAFSLLYFESDKLILYSGLTFGIAVIIRVIYQVYCRRKFEETRFKFEIDWIYYKELLAYSGWNLFGNLSHVAKSQGLNLVLNLFFGTVMNTAYGLSLQVQSAVTQFLTSFQSALNPQIIQSYAAENKQRSLDLMFMGSRLSFVLMLILVSPLILNTEYVLGVWLGVYPEETISIVKLVLVAVLIDSISGSFMTGILASGKIKIYNIIIGTINIFIVPISYFLLKLGYSYSVIFFVLLLFSFFSFFLRVLFLNNILEVSFSDLFRKLLIRIVPLIIAVLGCGVVVYNFYRLSLAYFVLSSFLLVVVILVAAFFITLTTEERNKCLDFIKKNYVR